MRRSRVGDIEDRFWIRVEKSKQPNGCWLWKGAISKTAGGYGVIAGKLHGKRYVTTGKNMLVHRVSWMMANGEIPENPSYHGMVVMHKCDTRLCVNPSHLELATQAANVRDMDEKGRANRTGISHKIGTSHPRAIFDNLALLYIRNSPLGTIDLASKMQVHRSTIRRARDGHTYG